MNIDLDMQLLAEFEIRPPLNQQLITLRCQCFPDTQQSRSYFKQLPQHRLLVFQDCQLIAHIGLEHRVITLNEKVLRIFGLIDVFVDPQHQGQGIASAMLTHLTKLGTQFSVDFLMAFATDPRIYQKNGFHLVDNYFQWLRVDEHKNYGVAIERIADEAWVKSLSGFPWTNGCVDLLGYLF
ncbi:MAG: GNAT family N-acetyltransferase [Leptolyngbyaceae cyanobacterium MAG.088]|nr:GNAT family N-acetyltransferase [Leptolyngbyaceae cyanobacterium MAG.088]